MARTGTQIAADKSANVDRASPGLERLYRFDGDADTIRDFTGKSVATPLPASDSLIASDAPVAPDPAPVVPYDAGAEVTSYVYDPWYSFANTSSDAVLDFTGGALSRRWLHGPAVDEPLAFEAYDDASEPGSGTAREIVTDRLGSILAEVEPATGTVAARASNDSFGARMATGEAGRYGFTGREHDAESGLIYFRARTYDPAAGLFLQRDPLGFGGGDINLYAYVWNDPLNWTDPSGLARVEYRAAGGFVMGLGIGQALRLALQRCVASPGCRSVAVQGLQQGAGALLDALGAGAPSGGTAPAAGSAPATCTGLCGVFSGALGLVDKIGETLDGLADFIPNVVQSNSGDEGENSSYGGISGTDPHPDGNVGPGGKIEQRSKSGGGAQAEQDFNDATGGVFEELDGGGMRGVDVNGNPIIFRPTSSGGGQPGVGPPTIYGPGYKIRYY